MDGPRATENIIFFPEKVKCRARVVLGKRKVKEAFDILETACNIYQRRHEIERRSRTYINMKYGLVARWRPTRNNLKK